MQTDISIDISYNIMPRLYICTALILPDTGVPWLHFCRDGGEYYLCLFAHNCLRTPGVRRLRHANRKEIIIQANQLTQFSRPSEKVGDLGLLQSAACEQLCCVWIIKSVAARGVVVAVMKCLPSGLYTNWLEVSGASGILIKYQSSASSYASPHVLPQIEKSNQTEYFHEHSF